MAGKDNGKKRRRDEDAPRPEEVLSAIGPYRMPHNDEAEHGVLGAMILDPDIIPEVVERVRSEDFYQPAHRLIFDSIRDLYNQGIPVDLTLLLEDLKKKGKLEAAGGFMRIASLEQFIFATGAAPEHAEMVAGKAKLRELMRASMEIIKECAEEQNDLDKQIDIAEKRIFDISQSMQSKDFVSVEETMPEVLAEIGHLRTQGAETTGVRSGFIEMDRMLNGLQPSDLLILAARPSIGKTAFALNLMLNVAWREKVPAAIFSLEMGREQLNKRLLCCHSEVSGYKISRGILTNEEFDTLREKATDLAKCPIFIDDSPGLSVMQVRSKARRLKAQQPNLGLIVVDYLQLMSGNDTSGREVNRQQEVSEISRGLKALARELHVPVLALSQLSRNIEQRSGTDKSAKPRLSDLRESGAIEQDADIVMFVHRERVETQRDEQGRPINDGQPIPTEIIIGKHRNGPTGTVDLHFWADITRFTNPSSAGPG